MAFKPGSSKKKLKFVETEDYIPRQYLNSLDCINYGQSGIAPWTEEDEYEIILPLEYESTTSFLGIDCGLVGVGHHKASALGRVSIVNEYGYCVYDTFVNPMVEITDYRTDVSGIRAENIETAPPVDVVLQKVADLVKGKTLVGHSIYSMLNILKLTVAIRDISLYYKKFSLTTMVKSLQQLTVEYLRINIESENQNSILNAQASMKLYMDSCDAWEKYVSQWLGKVNINTENAPLTKITEMHVEPRESDLFVDSKIVFVRPNNIVGPYSSSEEYLDVQFRLLLEDFLRPLRDSVQEINKGGAPMGLKCEILDSIRIRGNPADITGHLTVLVPIDKNSIANWEEMGMFMTGSLLLLSQDNFHSVKFVVVQGVKINDERKILYDVPVQVIFSKENQNWKVTDSDRFSMIESKAFYAAYSHTLDFLQTVDLDKYPMKKYIVDVVTRGVSPAHLRRMDENIDFSVLMQDGSSRRAKPLMLRNWPSATQLGLDNSQYQALQNALTQELTIIQGPPGTGKTFTSLQVIKMLLTNDWLCQDSPVLIVSFTNHALDQMLELILDFVTEYLCDDDERQAHQMILRIGSGSKSAKVEPLTMMYKIKKANQKHSLSCTIKLQEKLSRSLKGMNFDKWLLDTGILDFNNLPRGVLSKLALDHNCEKILGFWKSEERNIRGNTANWFRVEQTFPQNNRKKAGLFLLRCNLEQILPRDLPQIISMVQKKVFLSDSVRLTRWAQYIYLVTHFSTVVKNMDDTIENLLEEFEEVKHFEDLKFSDSSLRIVGMTTTGAAKNKKMIQNEFKSKIMIVEEAAQILEPHVVACLTQHCQQMILVGDHQQLRPLTADHELGEKYKLNISLMERLIENGKAQNSKNWVQLTQQHRMRPEIAKMICPAIYEHLENHPVVLTFPSVSGCDKNIFFVDHNYPERKERGSSSFCNDYEARYIVDKVKYFISGEHYKPTQITVIAAYAAQKNRLADLLKDTPELKEVRVSTVDGYQGEENDIIFLSLVRSSSENGVGFLQQDNRVCVALSRARHGFFMVGNMTCLKSSSKTWRKIDKILEDTDCIGSILPLSSQCNKAETTKPTDVETKSEDFEANPETDRNASSKHEVEVDECATGRDIGRSTVFPVQGFLGKHTFY